LRLALLGSRRRRQWLRLGYWRLWGLGGGSLRDSGDRGQQRQAAQDKGKAMHRRAPTGDRRASTANVARAPADDSSLRAGEFAAIDVENIAEEIESIGRSDRREIKCRLFVLLAHLLNWQRQPEMRSTSWAGTIREQRRKIEDLLDESPSLRPAVPEIAPLAYAEAREDAAEETGLPQGAFPEACPFTAEQTLSREFLPER
jgi:hypothetical protein